MITSLGVAPGQSAGPAPRFLPHNERTMKLRITTEEQERLTHQLDEAFESLPPNVRQVLRWCCPAFELLTEYDGPEGRTRAAWVEASGRMVFCGPLVAQFDEGAIPALVAHEAAHAVLLAIGGDWVDENAVDALATRWGYDMTTMPRVT